jgi:hypothetical protein
LAVIYSDIDREFLIEELKAGRVQPLGPVDELTEEEISGLCNLWRKWVWSPLCRPWRTEPRSSLPGAYDPTVLRRLPVLKGYDPALALHMGKILRMRGHCCQPRQRK